MKGVEAVFAEDVRRASSWSEHLRPARGVPELVRHSCAMRRVCALVERAARTDVTVFIAGETGTGKEVVARTLHSLSRRSTGPFVPLDCASVSRTLVESELFGHERGSFTGAERQHRGYFERAAGGTLFLDEVTEMPVELQAKLLRTLETSLVERVGGNGPIEVDVRVVAAANRPLAAAVRAGTFRADLMYRLNVFPIAIPPLRERGDDVVHLADHFVTQMNRGAASPKEISASGRAWLREYRWPGNVRELKNVLQRAFIMSNGTREIDLPPEEPEWVLGSAVAEPLAIPVGTSVAAAERMLVLATLDAAGGDKRKAATTLGISLKTLYNRLAAYGLSGGVR